MSKIILVLSFYIIISFSFLFAKEKKTASFLFFSNNSDVGAVLINTRLKEYIKIENNQSIQLQFDNNWVFQTQFNIADKTKRLTYAFKVLTDKKIILYVNTKNLLIKDLSFVYNQIVTLHDDLQVKKEDLLKDNDEFINLINNYNPDNQVKIKIAQYNDMVKQLNQECSGALQEWDIKKLQEKKNIIDNIIQSILNNRKNILSFAKIRYAIQILEQSNNYVNQAKTTKEYDLYIGKILQQKEYFISINDNDNLNKIIADINEIKEEKNRFAMDILSSIKKIKIFTEMKYSQIIGEIKILDDFSKTIEDTKSNFIDLQQKIMQLKKRLISKKQIFFKEYYQRNKEKIFKYSMYSVASIGVSISTISFGIGIASFVLRNYYIDNLNEAKAGYNNATNIQQINSYYITMQDSVTNANNYWTLGLVMMPLASSFLVVGVFLYFLNIIVKKAKQMINLKKANIINYDFNFGLDGNSVLLSFGLKL